MNAIQQPILFVGYTNIEDIQYPDRPRIARVVGGAALYAALAGRICGADVELVSRIGSDFPSEYWTQLVAARVADDGVVHVPGRTMAGLTEYSNDGSRRYNMYISDEERTLLSPDPSQIRKNLIQRARGVHLATMPPIFQASWIRRLRKTSPFISLDTDIAYVQSEPDSLRRLLIDVDAFFPNREEAFAFYPDLSLPDAAERLASLGPSIVGITQGKNGAHIYLRDRNLHIDVPAVSADVVDVTGAGDAFCGAFVATYLETFDACLAGWRGSATASVTIEDYGALHLLQYKQHDVEERIAHAKKGT